MKAVTKKLTVLSAEPVDKMKLARRTFTLEFKADVVRHRKAENLSWTDVKLEGAQYPPSRLRLARCARSCRG